MIAINLCRQCKARIPAGCSPSRGRAADEVEVLVRLHRAAIVLESTEDLSQQQERRQPFDAAAVCRCQQSRRWTRLAYPNSTAAADATPLRTSLLVSVSCKTHHCYSLAWLHRPAQAALVVRIYRDDRSYAVVQEQGYESGVRRATATPKYFRSSAAGSNSR
jgi:hypothetical protein